MKKTNEAGNGLRIIIFIALVTVFLVLMLVIATNIGRTSRSSQTNSVSDFQYELRNGKYHTLFQDVQNLRKRQYRGTSEIRKYEAIADYYQNALALNVYKNMQGSNAQFKAGLCEEAMALEKSDMKELDFAAAEIDALFCDIID